uniref:Uncharacterized protein n=1 Tax=Arundo donax TaxID=35708 RepID=A0A0A9E1F5_ARUDO
MYYSKRKSRPIKTSLSAQSKLVQGLRKILAFPLFISPLCMPSFTRIYVIFFFSFPICYRYGNLITFQE